MGLVFKTASDNHHTNVSALLEAAGYPHARVFDLSIRRHEQRAGLARVLGTSEQTVRALAHTEIRSTRALRTVRFLDAEVPDYDLTFRWRRISPATLQAEPFHRAAWTHRLLPFCPHSLELLLDTCPACGAKLDWFRAEGLTRCGRKGCDARLDGDSQLCLEENIDAYRRMAALAAPRDAARVASEQVGELKRCEPGAMFELGWRLARIVNLDLTPRNEGGKLSPQRIVATLATADDLLTGWPSRLPALLRDRLGRDGTSVSLAQLKELRRMVSAIGSWPQIAEVIRTTYPELVATGRQALRHLAPNIMTGSQAAKVARITPRLFAQVKRAGPLATVTLSGTERAFADFEQSVVAELEAAKRGSVPINAVVEELGIAQHGIEQLIVGGLLEQERNTVLRALYPQMRVTSSSVDALIAELNARGSAQSSGEEVPLKHAVKALAGEKPWGAIIASMLDGAIRYRIAPGTGRLLHRVRIDVASVPNLARLSFDRADHPEFEFAGHMTKRDAEEALNLVSGILPMALREELGRRETSPLQVTDIQRIARIRISPAEICARTALGARKLPEFLKRSDFRRVGAAGWVRSEIEPLLRAKPPP
ncbi:hypothetical protein [Sphingomonas sp.]|uniref:hypothetical protein n=1 Tax=Sphingomonas sp. TaxID=28214 RepID=UPI001EBCF5F9|nr:hypothetical protein [Sphingomonas sp.]MBX3595066.1 hypothetical protein [Sphingomonas sp.]